LRRKQYHSQAIGWNLRECIIAAIDSLVTDMAKDAVMVTEGSINVRFSDGQATAWFVEDEQ
jgi:hypothetical protein